MTVATTLWPRVKLGDLLSRSAETVEPTVDCEYREITVRLWGKGVVERGRVLGANLNGRRFVARVGQFIASRIDARNGAMGLVPATLEGALVTNDFPLFHVRADRLSPSYLGWLCRTASFVELCLRASEGTTNRVRLKEEAFLGLDLALPPMHEQQRIVARIDAAAADVGAVQSLIQRQSQDAEDALASLFKEIVSRTPRIPLAAVAPLVRRPIKPVADQQYAELGIRSFGRGTFHKAPVSGLALGDKRVYAIEPGDLLFSNVFAWEGAIAVAQPADTGRIGSHRFMTCLPDRAATSSEFLCYYFLTNEGLAAVRSASPGGAGRNRTLGVEALGRLDVPMPALTEQLRFGAMLSEVAQLQVVNTMRRAELDALLPAVLDRAFAGAL